MLRITNNHTYGNLAYSDLIHIRNSKVVHTINTHNISNHD